MSGAAMAPARADHPPVEPSGGKIRREVRCATCGRPRWGVFAWIEDQGTFTCNDGHETAYMWRDGAWREGEK